jgi:hypothetical protein
MIVGMPPKEWVVLILIMVILVVNHASFFVAGIGIMD